MRLVPLCSWLPLDQRITRPTAVAVAHFVQVAIPARIAVLRGRRAEPARLAFARVIRQISSAMAFTRVVYSRLLTINVVPRPLRTGCRIVAEPAPVE